MKVINDLLNYKGMKIVQDDKYFNFSLDSVLLPNFVTINTRINKVLDLGTGNAPIPLILTTRTEAPIYGIELQKEIYDLAVESVKLNKLENQITLINDNMKNLDKYFEINSFDVIVSNPPYFRLDENSNVNDTPQKTIARHEKEITLDKDYTKASGSTIITLASDYLNSLAIGTHTLQMNYDDGEVSREFSIQEKPIEETSNKANNSNTKTKTPNTGD